MTKKMLLLAGSLFLAGSLPAVQPLAALAASGAEDSIQIPPPKEVSLSLLTAMKNRRTVRNFDPKKSVTLQELGNLLFAMQGVTAKGKRTVPSSLGVYPMELYLVLTNVEGIKSGLYKYNVDKSSLALLKAGDITPDLAKASYNQGSVKNAQVKVIMTSVWSRLEKQGDNYQRWGYLESGAIGQNGMVMAAALGLNSVPVGGFVPEQVAKVISVDGVKETPVYINCYGR